MPASRTDAVMIVAASVAETKASGRGMRLIAGVASSPFGDCLIADSPRGICHLAFFDPGGKTKAIAELCAAWPDAEISWDHGHAKDLSERIFSRQSRLARENKGESGLFVRETRSHERSQDRAYVFAHAGNTTVPLRIYVCGTDFQMCVWRALLDIPLGTTVSYAMLAKAAGHPRACRAVGSAAGANPVAFLIPCHRVIRSDGTPGEFRWGADRKRAMLAWESGFASSL